MGTEICLIECPSMHQCMINLHYFQYFDEFYLLNDTGGYILNVTICNYVQIFSKMGKGYIKSKLI